MNLNQQIEQWLIAGRQQFCAGIDSAAPARDRPYVTLSYAQSWDGSISLRSGASLALSGEASIHLTHHLRSLHDGILVGIGTVLTDDPLLTVRMSAGPNPQPIVLDSQLRIPTTARLCHLGDRRCWVLTSRDGGSRADCALDVITLPGDQDGHVCLHEALRELKSRGIDSLMVEGGANVITAFLKERLVDALVLTIAPTLVGGYKAVNDLEISRKSELPQIKPLHTERLGDDLILWGNLHYNEAES